MIKKLIERWKREWWLKNASELAKEYQSKQIELEKNLSDEIRLTIQKLELERDVLYSKIKSEIEKGKILEEEVLYREKNLESRKLELIKADNELKKQIATIEAKASPSSVWAEAFTAGANKTWDLIIPVMTENISKLKKKIEEDATAEAIARLRVTNKK